MMAKSNSNCSDDPRDPACTGGKLVSNKSSGTNDDQRGVNVKVIVRCRPTSELERRDPSQFSVVSSKVDAKEVFVSQTIPGRKIESYSKTFTYDGVCNQYTTQQELFSIYVVPIVEEVLQGFNCTIFAYGQTGTGKTYTMEGDFYSKPIGATTSIMLPPRIPSATLPMPSVGSDTFISLSGGNGISPDMIGSDGSCPINLGNRKSIPLTEHAGIIPRSVQHIFDCLESLDAEYSVRVSYLEIYNEELNDLLNDGEKQNLRIYEDVANKKGLAVDRLEEVPVNNPQDILNILSIAVKKRRTAETLLNRQSSRSHCIFSVTIHMKETNIEGEDVIKIGKLNLVDLAGSENIQRSGANTIKDRAKEAGMINQSLLTLGRVINALVEHSSYIPYRDSKLTRLLQESLGGRTKTCIVATVSPSSLCLEESLSTLDYAFRAKNIRNRPEVNQRMTKRVMIRELNYELERLKFELLANREKNGVYLPYERFAEMESRLEFQEVELANGASEIQKLTNESAKFALDCREFRQKLEAETAERLAVQAKLIENENLLMMQSMELKDTKAQLEIEKAATAELRHIKRQLKEHCRLLVSQLNTTGAELEAIRRLLSSSRKLGKHIQSRVGQFLDVLEGKLIKQIEKSETEWIQRLEENGLDIVRRILSEDKESRQKTCQNVEAAVENWNTVYNQFQNEFFSFIAETKNGIASQLSTASEAIQESVKDIQEKNVTLHQEFNSEANALERQLVLTMGTVNEAAAGIIELSQASNVKTKDLVTDVAGVSSKLLARIAEGEDGTIQFGDRIIEKLNMIEASQSNRMNEGFQHLMDTLRKESERMVLAQRGELSKAINSVKGVCHSLIEKAKDDREVVSKEVSCGLIPNVEKFGTTLTSMLENVSSQAVALSSSVKSSSESILEEHSSCGQRLKLSMEQIQNSATHLVNNIVMQDLKGGFVDLLEGTKKKSDLLIDAANSCFASQIGQIKKQLEISSKNDSDITDKLKSTLLSIQSDAENHCSFINDSMDSVKSVGSQLRSSTLGPVEGSPRTDELANSFSPTRSTPPKFAVPESLLSLPTDGFKSYDTIHSQVPGAEKEPYLEPSKYPYLKYAAATAGDSCISVEEGREEETESKPIDVTQGSLMLDVCADKSPEDRREPAPTLAGRVMSRALPRSRSVGQRRSSSVPRQANARGRKTGEKTSGLIVTLQGPNTNHGAGKVQNENERRGPERVQNEDERQDTEMPDGPEIRRNQNHRKSRRNVAGDLEVEIGHKPTDEEVQLIARMTSRDMEDKANSENFPSKKQKQRDSPETKLKREENDCESPGMMSETKSMGGKENMSFSSSNSGFQRPTRTQQLQLRGKHQSGSHIDFIPEKLKRRRASSRESARG